MNAAAKAKISSKPKAPSKPESQAQSALSVDIDLQSPLWAEQPAAEQTVRDAIATAAALSTSAGEVSILLADDSAVRVLNREWRGIDKPTNVLSFPAPKKLPQGPAAVLGDIVIAYETLKRESDDEGREFLHHLTHLTVHGYLHLLGYDHQTETEAAVMEALESRIMTHMQLPDPWQDREQSGG
jgi:probable rRNA maturation factor